MTIPSIEEMLKAGMHFGHRTSKWHPKCAPFIFGERNDVHIIDLIKSRELLEIAMNFIKKFSEEGKTILFVATKVQAKKPIRNVAEANGMPYVSEKWMGGTITNFSIIKKMIKKYTDLLKDKSSGKLEKYTKKERLEFDREIKRLETKVGGLTNLEKLPDAIFIWDIKMEKTAITEARKKNIPVIGVCDTNANPTGINYVIPANDDATKTIKLIANLIDETIKEGKKGIDKK
ncbi:MAG: 30S ribosomal protein S2 [bacterium]